MKTAQSVVYRVALAAAVYWTCAAEVLAQDVVSREYAIKAGVVCLLGKFASWPPTRAPGEDKPLVIGILGKDPFVEANANQLDLSVAAENRKGRNIIIKRFDSVRDCQPCHILFIANQATEKSVEKSLADRIKGAKSATQGSNTLIVSESTGLARQGATANLIFDRSTNLIRLELNPDEAARVGVKLAPDLLRLKLVQIVRDGPG
jgi:hypothetical protein